MSNMDQPEALKTVTDPTSLTTQQVFRENYWLRELIETRLNAMDEALRLLQSRADRVPSEVDLKVGSLERLNAETFSSIDKQFQAINTLANQVNSGNKEAIAIALQANKEAASETKSSIDKRLDQSERQFNTAMAVRDVSIDGLNKSSTSLESRVTAIESRTVGQRHEQTTQQSANTSTTNIAGLIVGSLIGAAGLLLALLK